MSAHQHIATNLATSSENRIHSDEIAQRFGFQGALVAGVHVFGHMSYPLTTAFGEDWMRDADVSMRFLKPAYHGDALDIAMTGERDALTVTCKNRSGETLATLNAALDQPRPFRDRHQTTPDEDVHQTAAPEREEISMAAIAIDEPFAPFVWATNADENAQYSTVLGDDLAVYGQGLIHPHLILHYANQGLVRRFIMPAWIHVGSSLHFHRPLHVGERVEIRAVPTEKWERKGHEFIKLLLAYYVDGTPAIEIEHTAIFHIADSA